MRRDCLPLAWTVSVVALLFFACNGGGDATPFPTATVPPTGSGTVVTPEAASTSEATATTAPTLTPTARPATPQPVDTVTALGGRVFDRAIEFGALPGGRVFVADQVGVVLTYDLDGGNEDVLLDIRPRVSRDGNEEGLLSVALDPDFAANRHLWTYYSAADPRRSVLSRFTVGQFEADPSSELVILNVPQPFSNHNGGAIRFGPDGMLYLGFGDGGSSGDPLGSGQDRSTLLGSIIRIDVRNASAGTPYEVPGDNPFVGEVGVAPEVWAYGVRNPWRMSWDGGTLWVGDVGQGAVEEVSIVSGGDNLGWEPPRG